MPVLPCRQIAGFETSTEVDREGATSARLWQKRQEELAAERVRERRPE
jgi:hypothetical protein